MESKETKPGTMTLLRPPPDHCQMCATKHKPSEPHNAQSLYYGMRFKLEHGRDGTWADATAHCTEKLRQLWKTELTDMGRWTEPPAGVDPIAEPTE
jgi:hypothetical protein